MSTRLESHEPDAPSTIVSSSLKVVFMFLHSAVSTIPNAYLLTFYDDDDDDHDDDNEDVQQRHKELCRMTCR